MYRQYQLTSGNLARLCWVNNPNLAVGQQLRLQNDTVWPDRVWTVELVYDDMSKDPQWRTWKVGELL